MKKTAIITGASRGIGKAIAEEFARLDYNLCLISRHYEEIEKVSKELKQRYNINSLSFEGDVSDKEKINEIFFKTFKEFGSINVLVNNAGINSRKTINPQDIENWFENFDKNIKGWNQEIKINLTGTYICSYLAAKYMLKQKSGSIINISSIKGKEATSSPGYGASKAGVIKLTKDFAKALAPWIRVNCIAPGFINTGMTTELSEEKKNFYKKLIPKGRFGEIKEVAKVVVFLASSNSSYITGQTIGVDGGYLMN